MSLTSRVNKLERTTPARVHPDDCDGPTTYLAFNREGEHPEPTPDDAARCRKCGEVHRLDITEVVVTSRDDVAGRADRLGITKGTP